VNIFIASIENNIASLTPEESRHCTKVLRHKTGDKISIIDGKGNFYEGVLTLISEKKSIAEITSGPIAQKKKDYYLHLAIAPTKQIDRIEWMLEKAIEIGIDEITFIQSKNSERVVIKPERLLKIIESAVKQSLQAFIPQLNDLISFNEFVLKSNETENIQKLIAHCEPSEKSSLKSLNFRNRSTLALIGPEGDFTKEEINFALKNNFQALSLGDNRLRTETAGLYICQAVSILS